MGWECQYCCCRAKEKKCIPKTPPLQMFGLKVQHRMQFSPQAAVFACVLKCVWPYRQLLCRCCSELFAGRMNLVFVVLLLSEALFSHFTRRNLCLLKRFKKHYSRKLNYQISSFSLPPSFSSRDIPHWSSSKLPLPILFVNTADFPASLRQGMFPPQNDCLQWALAERELLCVSFIFLYDGSSCHLKLHPAVTFLHLKVLLDFCARLKFLPLPFAASH